MRLTDRQINNLIATVCAVGLVAILVYLALGYWLPALGFLINR